MKASYTRLYTNFMKALMEQIEIQRDPSTKKTETYTSLLYLDSLFFPVLVRNTAREFLKNPLVRDSYLKDDGPNIIFMKLNHEMKPNKMNELDSIHATVNFYATLRYNPDLRTCCGLRAFFEDFNCFQKLAEEINKKIDEDRKQPLSKIDEYNRYFNPIMDALYDQLMDDTFCWSLLEYVHSTDYYQLTLRDDSITVRIIDCWGTITGSPLLTKKEKPIVLRKASNIIRVNYGEKLNLSIRLHKRPSGKNGPRLSVGLLMFDFRITPAPDLIHGWKITGTMEP